MTAKRRAKQWRPKRDWGRLLAVVLCAVFAVVGAVPLGLGFLVRTTAVRTWVARETSSLVARELGVAARYEVTVQAWPMMIALSNVVVDAEGGGAPFLEVERVAVHPRFFSLLAGQLDAGDVEVVGPRLRVVVNDGELANLRYQLPEPKGPSSSRGPPLASLSVTDAHVDATIDGTMLGIRELDVDVSAEQDSAYEIAFRSGPTTLTRVHPFAGREATEDAVDEDIVCRLEARARWQGRSLLVRRLLLDGSADFDPDPGTRPSCQLRESDWRAVSVRLGAVHVELPSGGPVRAGGRVHARVPLPLAHRFVKLPHVTGAVTLDVEADYDASSRLPRVVGHVVADRPGVEGKIFGKRVELDVTTGGDIVRVTDFVTSWADGSLRSPEIIIEPFNKEKGCPLTSGPITFEDIEMAALVRDLGAHPEAHVTWTLEKGRFEYFRGPLVPLFLEGPLTTQTRDFEIFDRPVIDPRRSHRMGIREGVVRTTFIVNGQQKAPYDLPGIVLANTTIETPHSRMFTTVTLGFNSVIEIDVRKGTRVDLSELSPLGNGIGIGGMADLAVRGRGPFTHPKLAGDVKIDDFMFAGFPIGDLETPRLTFEPLVVDLRDPRLRHGQSRVRAPSVKLDFGAGAVAVTDAEVDTTEAPGLRLRDLFEVFHLDKDPRFADIDARASGKARVRYVVGGREDRCGGGMLSVRSSADLDDVTLLGERFDHGTADFDWVWDDLPAGAAGMKLELRSATLQKGDGIILASAEVRHGGHIDGNLVASGIPLGRLDAVGSYGKLFDGTASMVAQIGGTLGALTAGADVNVSRLRIGPSTLGPSHLNVAMLANPPPPHERRTACGNPYSRSLARVEAEKDPPDGYFRVDGALFDGQVAVDDLRISRQKHKVVTGAVTAKDLDLGTLANLIPGVAYTGAPPRGALSAKLAIKSLPLDVPQRAVMGLVLDGLDLEREGARLRLSRGSGQIELVSDELKVPELEVSVRSASGLAATVVAGGVVRRAISAPDVDMGVRVAPMDLARLSADIPSVDRAGGVLEASLRIMGPPSSLRYTGAASLRKGEIGWKGLPVAVTDADVDVEIGGGEARFTRAKARMGTGSVNVTGRVPLRGPEAGAFLATIRARGVKLPVADGINLTADAELEASYRPASGEQKNLPDVKGTVELTSFAYTRPIALNLSLGQIGRAPRTTVDAYDPANDVMRFNIKLVSPHPLRFSNNLVEAELQVMSPGLVLSGTNQRFGARGLLRILPDSKVTLRNNDFLVREGFVRFDDPLKIAPKVDVRATTEYRRYAASAEAAATAPAEGGASAGASPVSTTTSTSAAGIWRITLHARGDAEDLKVALSSDPALSQEDIVFLLTMGMTRAEMDRAAASALGETVGLEALSALTGADKAVKKIVPLIDEFRFGTGYSSRTARTEPTVTVGKRITDALRASVTTGVSEDREVRSNIEWRLNRRMGVQMSYDNLNDVSGSPLGNIGVDFRWRLEFE